MLTTSQSLIVFFVIALCTLLTRALPFLLFRGKQTPALVSYLGQVLPFAIMGMLVVYCLKGITPLRYPFALPELIAVAGVVALHLWRRNTRLSIAGGTLLYMALVQFVFV